MIIDKYIEWNKTSKEDCVEIIKSLREELYSLQVRYDERAASMRETANQVRSLYVGSEVSKRILNYKRLIGVAIGALKMMQIAPNFFNKDGLAKAIEELESVD